MPRALAANRDFLRSEENVPNACLWSFTNQVSNTRPADPIIFAVAVEGLVRRIVEGSHGQPGIPVRYWEFWNEPDWCYFWDPFFENLAPCNTHRLEDRIGAFLQMAVPTLIRLDEYRQVTAHPVGAAIRIGLASFANADVAVAAVQALDSLTLPSGGHVPMDFISFHAYHDDPLDIVAKIVMVADAVRTSQHYQHLELSISEWGPALESVVAADTMDQPLLMSTVIALGAAQGLSRAHHTIFYDFYPSIQWGLVDHAHNLRPLHRGYLLLSQVIRDGAVRLEGQGLADGRLDQGQGAVLTSRDQSGLVRVLLINRNDTERTARVDLDGEPMVPGQVHTFADPTGPIQTAQPNQSVIQIPPRSMVLLEQ